VERVMEAAVVKKNKKKNKRERGGGEVVAINIRHDGSKLAAWKP